MTRGLHVDTRQSADLIVARALSTVPGGKRYRCREKLVFRAGVSFLPCVNRFQTTARTEANVNVDLFEVNHSL